VILHKRRIVVCATCGHTRPHAARGDCNACYKRWLRRNPSPHRIPPDRLTIDEQAVTLAVTGERPVTLNMLERRAAYRQLQPRGLSAAQIAARIGCHQRTVVRYRAAERAQGASQDTDAPD
jgi:hypothetical protein